ncbi:uncharacterized protein LOC143036222 [Oratosquilla oratoria]|uniref:uncharacterized protein LOC143036222 n=1 Tax=Oratosquilla oratoria TaxID=337810 RepID=UPI003F763D05
MILPEYVLRVENKDIEVVRDFMNDMDDFKTYEEVLNSRNTNYFPTKVVATSIMAIEFIHPQTSLLQPEGKETKSHFSTTFKRNKLVLLAALVALATADTAPLYGHPAPPPAPAKYDFNYAVKDEYSGNDFGHQEARDGYDTQGSYYVLLPDGRLQKVAYTVIGDAGFVADVTYEGEAKYPEYKPPPPAYA